MNTLNLLPSITLEPNQHATYCTIWMHGLGADGNDFTPVISELNTAITEKMRFVFPHAPIRPVTINSGYPMRAWFDIYDLSLDSKVDQEGIQESVHHINQLISHEIRKGIPAQHIFLAGFSQGSVIALIAGLTHFQTLGGVIALSGFLPMTNDAILELRSPANQHLPIFLAHGQQDSTVPYPLGLMTKALLEQVNQPVSWHAYPIPHSVCSEEMQDISSWLMSKMEEE